MGKPEKKLTKKLAIALAGTALALLFSCASTGSFADIDHDLRNSNFATGISRLESKKSSLYNNRDTILYNLDMGMLYHYAELHAESAVLLQKAEYAIEEAFTKSISQEIATYLINDNTRDYSGEDYEDIYINAFNALNYHHQGKSDGAMVEIRRMNNKLQALSQRHGAELTNLQKKAIEENNSQLPSSLSASSRFNNSAFARYLGMLFYRNIGLYDEARIDRDYLLAAFANAPSIYYNQVPQSISSEMEIPKGLARLNMVAFSGLSPVKKETVIRIPLLNGHWIRIAYPEMESRHSEVQKIQLEMDRGDIFQLELLEDIDAVAKETFKTRQQIIYLKTVIRSVVKSVSSSAFDVASKETEGGESLVFGLLSLFTQVAAEASEQADVRISRFFPGKVYVGGINLPPGTYSFSINYYNAQGHVVASIRHENMEINEYNLNLAQAVCLR